MNEHDSERIAGLLEADGLTAAPDAEHADVVVLNSCCIRENADNKLYGNLGVLKAVKDRRPPMQVWVAAGHSPRTRPRASVRRPRGLTWSSARTTSIGPPI